MILFYKKNDKNGGFAILIFIVIMAMALLFLIIKYSESQKYIADNVREIIKSERSLQSSILCTGYISNTLARYPILNADLVLNIKNFTAVDLVDENYWMNVFLYSNYNKNKGEYFNCKVIDFSACKNSFCSYYAVIEGFNTFNNKDENNHSKIYIEWRLDEYRFYISKLRLI